MSGKAAKAFSFVGSWTDRIERGVLTALVTGMVVLAALQILLRNVWDTGLPWAAPLLGMALLWLTLLGALAAAGQGRHLAIDLATALLPRSWGTWTGRFMSLFGAIVCGMLAWASGHYVGFQRDMDMGELLGVPLWKHYMAIPVVFWLISARFAIRAIVPSAWIRQKDEDGLLGEGRVSL